MRNMDITPVQSEWGLRDVNTTPIQAKNILRRTPLHTLRCVYFLGEAVFSQWVHLHRCCIGQASDKPCQRQLRDMPATYERAFGVVGMGGSRRKAGERSGEVQWSPSMAWSPPRMLRWRTAMCRSWTSRFSIVTGAQHASLAAFGSQAVCHSAT